MSRLSWISTQPPSLRPFPQLPGWNIAGAGSDLYKAATALYEKYRLIRGSNIGRAKRSKLLHLKRPWLGLGLARTQQ